MIKKILKTIGVLIILWIVGFVLLVRLGKLSVTDRPITIFGYDKIENKFIINDYMSFGLNGKDGAYLLDEGDHYELVTVAKLNGKYELKRESVVKDSIININIEVENLDNDQFNIDFISDHFYENHSEYQTKSKIIALSDIEGNFNAFASFLIANKVIDKNFDWIFEDGHLVLVGDFMDRGLNVTQCLWLIYKLEHEAELQNGKVHFVVGNHEAMNLQGNLKYVADKYKGLIQEFTNNKNYTKGYKDMYNKQFVLGKWLKSKNVILKVNNTLFVHGGISPEIIDTKLDVEEINNIARANLSKNLYGQTDGDQKANLIMGRIGPMWYRGMVMDYKDYYKKMNSNQFNEILKFFEVEQIVIGHTVVEDIQLDYNKNLINIDVKHGKEKHSGKTKGILIDGDYVYKIDDQGLKEELKTP